jgi:hypothetical protein
MTIIVECEHVVKRDEEIVALPAVSRVEKAGDGYIQQT